MSTSQRGAPDTEAVVLAFMIADIRGYSRFSREYGDAAAAALAKRFAELARDAVEARGGTVVELRGDEAFATFPTAAQAVQAAVEFQLTCVEESERDPSLPLLVGVGIDVGPAVPVEDGYRGIAINLAARLCSAAGANQVLITAAAAEQSTGIHGDIAFDPRGAATFKGFDEPVSLVEAHARWTPVTLADAAGEAEPIPPELLDPVPLVGRIRETGWLRGIWRQVRRGRGRVITVSGPAGIGKTRLAAELAAHVQGFAGRTRYAGPGGLATVSALAAVAEAREAQAPSLVVIDQFDIVGQDAIAAVADAVEAIASRPVLLLLLLRDAAGAPAVAELVDHCTTEGGHRQLPPLGAAEVADVVALYAGEAGAEAPVEMIVRASRGIPALVHEQASDWARSETSRRLEAAAEFMAAARDRRASDLQFANNVIGLKLGRLYAPEGASSAAELDSLGPYKGLASFEQEDAAWFFGREQLVGELAARVVGSGALAVLGASGSGKSSVVAAGLLPSLRAGLLPGSSKWSQASVRPGQHPMTALRAALSNDADDPIAAETARLDDDGRLVLFIDQFEEVFTTCENESEGAEFLELLAGNAARQPEKFVAVATLRSDFYGDLAAYPALAGLFADNHVLLSPLSRAELHRVIQLPAHRAGVRIESALVDALVEEATGEPGALPLLSTALVELWQARSGGWIRAAAYHEGGGIRGAVARLAEASYGQLDEADQVAARRVLLRLASSTEGDAATRRRVELEEFDLDRDVSARRVVDRFVADRLLTVSGTTVEVAHEALLREWPRLRVWLEEDVQGRQLGAHLATAARGWDAAGRERSELYRGARLTAALEWAGDHPADLNDLERAFVNAGREASQAEAESARRTNRRLRALLAGAVVLLLVAAVAGVVALAQRSSARHAADRAQQAALLADARRLAALSFNAPDIATSSLLAVAGFRLQPSPDTRGALLAAVERSQSALWRLQFGHRPQRISAAHDGSLLAISDNINQVLLVDPRTRKEVDHFTANDGWVMGFAPGDKQLITYGPTNAEISLGRLATYDVAGDHREHVISDAGDLDVSDPAVTSDGRWIALITTRTYPRGRVIDIFDATNLSEPPRRLRVSGEPVNVAAGSSTVAVQDADGSVRVYAVPSDRLIGAIPAQVGGAGSAATVALSPDGSQLLRSDPADPSRAAIYSVADGTHAATPLPAQPSSIGAAAFSPDGRELAIGSQNGSLNLYRASDGAPIETLAGHAGALHSIAWAGTHKPSGLYTVALDSQLISWDLAVGPRIVTESGPAITPSPRAERYGSLVLGDVQRDPSAPRSTRQLYTLDLRSGQYRSWSAGLRDNEGIGQVVGSFDGRLELVSITAIDPPHPGHNRIAIVDLRRHRTIGQLALPAHTAHFIDGLNAAISPDGRYAYCSLGRTRIGVFALPSGRYLRSYELHFAEPDSGRIAAIPWQIDPSGHLIVAGFDPGPAGGEPWSGSGPPLPASQRLAVVDASSGRILSQMRLGNHVPTALAWSPDRRLLAVGTYDGTLTLNDATTLQPTADGGVVAPFPIHSLDFSPDGTNLVVGSSTVSFLSVPALTPEGVGISIGDASATGGLWVWYAANGDAVGLAPDLRRGESGMVRWFDFADQPDRLISVACGLAGSDITPAQWRRYVGDRPYQSICPAH